MVLEDIDVSDPGMVVLYNYLPDISEFIQICGRLRKGGTVKGFWSFIPPSDSDMPVVNPEKDITKQMCDFYGLPVPAAQDASFASSASTTLTVGDENSSSDNTTVTEGSTFKRPRLPFSRIISPRVASVEDIPVDNSVESTNMSVIGVPVDKINVRPDTPNNSTSSIPLLATRRENNAEHPLVLRPRIPLLPLRRSFYSMNDSSSDSASNVIRDDLKSKFSEVSTVFALLDIPVPHYKWLYFDGMNEASIGNVWYPRNYTCKKCLMGSPANCICYQVVAGKRKWLKDYYVEGLLLLKFILVANEYEHIYEVAATDDPYTVLLNIHSNAERYSNILKEMTGNYTSFMDFNFHNTVLDGDTFSIRFILITYCDVWSMLKEAKGDPIHFFSMKNCNDSTAELFWGNENLDTSIRCQLEKHSSTYAELPFMTENGGNAKFLLNLCFGYINDRVLNYDANYDEQMLQSQINNLENSETEIVTVPYVPDLMYKIMVGCLYFNPGFQEYLKVNWPALPECRTFSYCLKFSKEKTTFNKGGSRKKYNFFFLSSLYIYINFSMFKG